MWRIKSKQKNSDIRVELLFWLRWSNFRENWALIIFDIKLKQIIDVGLYWLRTTESTNKFKILL